MGLDSLTQAIGDLKNDALGFIGANPTATAVGAGAAGVAIGGTVGAIVGATVAKRKSKSRSKSSRKRSRKHKRIRHTRRGWAQDRRRRSKQKWEVAYRRRKKHRSKSRKGIHYTKNGQPYKILASGKARFIKRRSKR